MILRILQTLSAVLLSFLAATLVAEALILAYLWSAWNLDRNRLEQILAVAQGIETPAPDNQGAGKTAGQEQASYEEIAERRAARYRDLELRELALQNALDQLEADQKKLAEAQAKHQQVTQQFDAQLAALDQQAQDQGREEVRAILEQMKAHQAKIQLMQMLDNNELDEVVLLLTGMQSSKRAKILAEFKNEEENKQIAEVLRRIREGDPTAAVVQQARRQLNPGSPAGR